MSTSTTTEPSVEEVEGYNTDALITFLNGKNFGLNENEIQIIRDQGIDGASFLMLNEERFKECNIKMGPRAKLVNWINNLNNQRNTQNSASVYRFVRQGGEFKIWEIEEDPNIFPQKGIGQDVFNNHPVASAQGSAEVVITQPFCKNVVSEINDTVNSMKSSNLRVYGDGHAREKDQIYADIIIGHTDFHKELTDNPPDLSKGLSWEVKSNFNEGSKVNEGKGQLIKYARIYLSARPSLTNVFYGCLTDGKIWQFVKIQLMLDDIDELKVIFEESITYEWSEKTASLIAGIIERYHDDLSMRASGEKKESQNNDETYMYRNKSSISTESLLASFIEEGIYIRSYSENHGIHVQIISHLGNGRECIVFLAQVRDYGIKDAVLKIEVRRDSEISQVYREISALHGLDGLSCVPKILFEGYTIGRSLALLTDFAGQPLESWISNNGNIDDYTIFHIILDLLSCLEKIHACGYTHGDVAIRNVIQRNGHFYLIDFGLATLLQLHSDPYRSIIQDYDGLCQIIGFIKFGEKMSFSELIGKLEGELKSLVVFVEDASRWKITNEEKWLEKFGAKVKRLHEKGHHLPRKAFLDITENNIL
ncbi:protein kinase [Rhizophagus clarus]|uniref:Protein kinase n=1 Tax=Rhizophagus clarus TaxID=94130 RepID=A0A8H3LNW5_9GLOM|nr:protein kinase [Rhizophagus clarus]